MHIKPAAIGVALCAVISAQTGGNRVVVRPKIPGRRGIGGVFVDEEFDVRTLPVGPPEKAEPVGREVRALSQASRPLASYALPPANILKAGTYTLWVSVGTHPGTPKIALPLADEDAQRRYRLGEVRIVE